MFPCPVFCAVFLVSVYWRKHLVRLPSGRRRQYNQTPSVDLDDLGFCSRRFREGQSYRRCVISVIEEALWNACENIHNVSMPLLSRICVVWSLRWLAVHSTICPRRPLLRILCRSRVRKTLSKAPETSSRSRLATLPSPGCVNFSSIKGMLCSHDVSLRALRSAVYWIRRASTVSSTFPRVLTSATGGYDRPEVVLLSRLVEDDYDRFLKPLRTVL